MEAITAVDLPAPQQRLGLDTVRKLLVNVIESPEQERYRRINRANPAIQSKLFPACFDLLRAAGFQDEGDLLYYRGDPKESWQLQEAQAIVESLLLSLGGPIEAQVHTAAKDAATSASSQQQAASVAVRASSSTASAKQTPMESKRTQQQQRQDREREEARAAQANQSNDLATLRRQRAGRYQEEQDAALARHLSGAGDAPFDAISALNRSRGATYSFVTCSRCDCSLRYNTGTRAQAVLCPCGMLLQPLHMRGQAFRPHTLSDTLPEPGEIVDRENRPRQMRGPHITLRGPDGQPARLPLHSVLQMVRQQEERQNAGAEDETIEALPTRTYAAADGAECAALGTNCQICLEDFREGDELRTLPCFHLFHAKCVDEWLKINSVCPTCRHKIG